MLMLCEQGRSKRVVTTGWCDRAAAVTANRYTTYLGRNKNVLELDSGDGCRTL